MTHPIDLRSLIDRELAFPADRETVLTTLGGITLAAPTADEETVGAVLARTDAVVYGSADELFDAIVGNLSEEYIGRKFYDDRGQNLQAFEPTSI